MKKQNRIEEKPSSRRALLQWENSAATETTREIKVITVREEPVGYGMLPVSSPEMIVLCWAALVTRSSWYDREKEQIVSFCLDTRLKVKSFCLVSIGSVNETIAHPREIFRPAIADSAFAVVIAHNHPTGNSSPSMRDRMLTRRIYWAGDLMQIPLLDHVIIGDSNHFSFRESLESWPPVRIRRARLPKTQHAEQHPIDTFAPPHSHRDGK